MIGSGFFFCSGDLQLGARINTVSHLNKCTVLLLLRKNIGTQGGPVILVEQLARGSVPVADDNDDKWSGLLGPREMKPTSLGVGPPN